MTTDTNLPANLIHAGNNDRTVFDADGLAELAGSIAAHGLAQAVTVRPCTCATIEGDHFEIVAGERRFRAITTVNGSDTVPCVVRNYTDQQASAIMLAENVAREDLDIVAEATAYRARMDTYNLTTAQVAEWAGVSVARVTTRLPVLDVIDEARELVRSGGLSINHVRSMADLDANRQRLALRAMAKGNLTYFAFAELCQRLRDEQGAEGMELFTMSVEEYAADATEAAAAKGRSKNALIAAMADALEASGLSADLVAEARKAVAK